MFWTCIIFFFFIWRLNTFSFVQRWTGSILMLLTKNKNKNKKNGEKLKRLGEGEEPAIREGRKNRENRQFRGPHSRTCLMGPTTAVRGLTSARPRPRKWHRFSWAVPVGVKFQFYPLSNPSGSRPENPGFMSKSYAFFFCFLLYKDAKPMAYLRPNYNCLFFNISNRNIKWSLWEKNKLLSKKNNNENKNS